MWCCHWIGSHGPSGVLCTMTTQLQHTVSLLRGNRTEDESFRLILQKYYIIQGQERICKCPHNLIFLPPLPYFRWSDDPKKDFPSNRGTDWSSLWTWDSLWKGFNLAQHVLGFRGKKTVYHPLHHHQHGMAPDNTVRFLHGNWSHGWRGCKWNKQRFKAQSICAL